MKRAVIIHCWGGVPNYAWYPWAKIQLEAKGYVVKVPDMPNTHEPQLAQWLAELKHTIGDLDEELVLIGHSLGTVTIMRYLESLTDSQNVGKVILVAGFTDQIGFRELENFFESRLNYEKIKSKSARGFSVIQSDDDPYVSEQYGIRLRDELGAGLTIKHGALHMSGAIGEAGSCLELPDIIEGLA